MSVGRYVRITGQVQGVFFRAWTQQQAQSLGVTGWIRNCPDGSVEAKLAGDEGAVSQLIDGMHEGPSGAEVDHVEVEDVATEVFDRFEVRH
jgi:acylphosphatase